MSAAVTNLPQLSPATVTDDSGLQDDLCVAENDVCAHYLVEEDAVNDVHVECASVEKCEWSSGQKHEVLVGSLAKCVRFWQSIGACKFVLKVIEDGYVLPLTSLPCVKVMKNHDSTSRHADFVSEAIEDLISRGCVRPALATEVTVCSPLGVVDNGKKLRLILDLRYVNNHLLPRKFKLEDLKSIARIYELGDYLITFDLKKWLSPHCCSPRTCKVPRVQVV